MQNCRVKNPMGAGRVMNAFLSSYERIILEPKEPLEIRKDTLIKLSFLVIHGLPDLGDHFDTDLVDMFTKVYTEVLDVNLVTRFSNLKKLSDAENEQLELLKEGLKWYEVIVREIGRRKNKSREQNRRNDLLLNKMERKLSSNVKKIQARSVILK